MTDEILNIEYHHRILLVKALNKTPNKVVAAKKLGVGRKTIDRMCVDLEVIFNGKEWVTKTTQK